MKSTHSATGTSVPQRIGATFCQSHFSANEKTDRSERRDMTRGEGLAKEHAASAECFPVVASKRRGTKSLTYTDNTSVRNKPNKAQGIMAVDGCGLVCKYILYIFNVIFAVVGIAFLGLGLWLRCSDSTRAVFEIEALNSSAFVIAVTVLITVGVVLLIVVSFGDYGACSENRCALQVFSALLSFLATFEVIVGVLAYTKREEIGLRSAEFYSSIYTLYVTNGDPVIGLTLTFIHKMLHCCGITGVSLVEVVKQTCPNPSGFLERIKMDSCPVTIASVFDSKASLVMGVFIGTGALLIIALICSTTLSKKIQQSASAPQYIILTNTTSVSANPQLSQHEVVSTSYTHPDQDPVVFTPLTVASIPMAPV